MMSAPSCPIAESAVPAAPRLLEKLLTGALLTFAIGLTVANPPAYSAEASDHSRLSHSTQPASIAPAQFLSALPDGTYLFGQSKRPNQVGVAYIVVDVRDRALVGALYMPSSSFDCFRGNLQPNQLALTVVNSDDQTSHAYAIPLQKKAVVASGKPQPVPVELVGYHPISTLSKTDYAILETCKANQ